MTRRLQPPPVAHPGRQQRDLVTECGSSCPTCGGPWKAAKRVCRSCGEVIGRGQKWKIVPAGFGTFAYQHREPCGK